MRDLLGRDSLAGATFLDIGSGSGLCSLVASNMGASVTSFDFDEESVRVTASMRVLAGREGWRVLRGSILDQTFVRTLGTFDVVYAWGVLHHTGGMWEAIANAAGLVRPGGTLVVSLYRKTPLCSAWRLEKRFYASAPRTLQAAFRALYKSAYLAGLIATGRNPARYIREYRKNRGMEWRANVHDWLGGYPYESARAIDVKRRLSELGFMVTKSIERAPGLGLLGSGCDEFVAVKA